jgi:hypothetical protein
MNNEEEYKQVNIRLKDEEIAAIREITQVDAVATAVVAIVRQKIVEHKKSE